MRILLLLILALIFLLGGGLFGACMAINIHGKPARNIIDGYVKKFKGNYRRD